jgi:hypothetical protein
VSLSRDNELVVHQLDLIASIKWIEQGLLREHLHLGEVEEERRDRRVAVIHLIAHSVDSSWAVHLGAYR